MDGMHDLGGKQGFGRIGYPPAPRDESWERLARALNAIGLQSKTYNMDEYRHAIERMTPVHYVSAPYFERMLTAAASLFVEKGIVGADELAARAGGAFPLAQPLGPGRRNAPAQSFGIGEFVRVKNDFTSGHTRMPGYIRGKTGSVVGVSPATPFPDASAHNIKVPEEPSYDVRFRSEELWPEASDRALVHVGVFQSYLEKVTG